MVSHQQASKYLSKHKMSHLKLVAKMMKISGYSGLKKADLVDLILSNYLKYDEIQSKGRKLLEVSTVLKAYIPNDPEYEPNAIKQFKKG